MEFLQSILGGDETDVMFMGAAVMFAAVIVIIMVLVFGGGSRKQMKRRMGRVKRTGQGDGATLDAVVNIKRSTDFSGNKFYNEMIKKFMPRPENLRHKLSRAGLSTTLGTYIMISAAVGLLGFIATSFIPIVPPAAAVMIGILLGVGLPYASIKYLASRRRRKFLANFSEAIDLMVRGIKSGLPITETIKVVGSELPDPVGLEFRGVSDAVRFGQKLDEALWDTSKRLDISEFNFFTVSLAIQSETGGNLAETLQNLSEVLRRRRQMMMKIKAFASEPKASAYIIGSLPFVMFGLIYMMSPDYIMKLLTDPRGWMMLAVGGASFVTGIGVMIKMVKFEI